MKTRMIPFAVLAAILLTMCPLPDVDAAVLYGHSDWSGSGELYCIDTGTQAVTLVGTDAAREYSGPDIAVNGSGSTIFMSQADDDLFLISPETGLNTGTLSLSNFPANTDTPTALEFVGTTLYGSFHMAGPESNDGILGTINTITGTITTIGPMTGMNRPTGGLEYVGTTMYAVSATDNNDSRLFTVNLVTGAATLVGNLTLGGVQQEAASALAYGDGKMYTVLMGDTNLYSINLGTGAMTLEFDMGEQVNSLTTGLLPPCATAPVPTLNEWGLIMLSLLMIGIGYITIRRRNSASA